MSELKILKVKDANSKPSKPLHPHLPQPPACVLMVSPVKTGKSTIISNLLLNDKFYGPEYFDDVMVISNTINNDLTSRFIKEHFDVEDHYDDSMIEKLIERQTSFKKKEDQPEVALVLDDILGSLKSGSLVNTLSARFRHYNIKLLLFSTQVFRLSHVVRQNTTDLIVGSPFPNRKELLKVAEEYGSVVGGQQNWLKIYAAATPERYNFLYMDLQSNPVKCYRNFEVLVSEGENIVGAKDISKETDGTGTSE